MKKTYWVLIIILLVLVNSCDIYAPRRKFRLAVPSSDYFYNYITSHLKPFLENNGYEIEIVPVQDTDEANKLVAEGKADLCFINNHSIGILGELGDQASLLRTVIPLSTRLLLAFSKEVHPDNVTIKELFENRRVGIESLGGEAEQNLKRFITTAKIGGVNIVSIEDKPDVIAYWGTFYGQRASKLLDEGWHPFSFKENWIEFITLNDPAVRPFTLPAIPGDSRSVRINTIATEVVLVTNRSIGENSIYELVRTIHSNKLSLMHKDTMYGFIADNIDHKSLLYPVHEGTAAYIRRDQPTFFERYADVIALVLSVLAVTYGAIQAVRAAMAQRKKDHVDKYFLEFLKIHSNRTDPSDTRILLLDELFHRSLQHMTDEKLDKSDFHILSMLIQQEQTIIRIHQDKKMEMTGSG